MKVDYDDLIINYNEKMEIIEKQDIKINVLNREIERLNNILNELEKWLKKEMKDLNVDTYVEYQLILNKIKELKGSDKE